MNREEAKKKAEALVARMTLEEKASQLRYDAPAIKRLGIPAYNWWNEGLHGVARAGQAWIGAIHRAVGVSSLMREPVSSTTRGAATIRLLFPTAYRADTVLQTVSTCLRNWVVPRLSRTSMVMVLPTNSGII